MPSSVIGGTSDQERLEREARELQERASTQQVQVQLHPAAGLVELQMRERLGITTTSVYVSLTMLDAIYAAALNMKLAAQGITVGLQQQAPGGRAS